MTYLKRTLENQVTELALQFSAIAIYGSRQVGKTTMLFHLFNEQFEYVTLDDIDERMIANQSPKLFLDNHTTPLIIDEIQKAPPLLDEIKRRIDQLKLASVFDNHPISLQYLLTGSNRFELQEKVSESLAGRCAILNLYSLSFAEAQQLEPSMFSVNLNTLKAKEKAYEKTTSPLTISTLFETIYRGGMPELLTSSIDRNTYFSSYINTYIEKDIRFLVNASNEFQFRQFLSIVALRTGQQVDYQTVCNIIGINIKTCKKWLSILETSGIITFLQPFMASPNNRVIKTPKLYFMDTGLCAYLCNIPDVFTLQNGIMNGPFVETYVVSEIIKNLSAFNMNYTDKLFYYRDIDNKKIDLLWYDQVNHQLTPIEIKTSQTPKNPAKNFNVLKKYEMDINHGLIIDTADKIRPLDSYNYSIPIHLISL